MMIKKITATVRDNAFMNHIMEAIAVRPRGMKLDVAVPFEIEFKIETEDDKSYTLVLPNVEFLLSLNGCMIFEHLKDEIPSSVLESYDLEKEWDVFVNGWSFFESLVNLGCGEDDEFHHNAEHDRIVEMARLLHSNKDAILEKARMRIDITPKYDIPGKCIVESLETALDLCGLSK